MKKLIPWLIVFVLFCFVYYLFTNSNDVKKRLEERDLIIKQTQADMSIIETENSHLKELIKKTEITKGKEIDKLKHELAKKPKVIVKKVKVKGETVTKYIVDNSGIRNAVDKVIESFIQNEKNLIKIISNKDRIIERQKLTIKDLVANSNKIADIKEPLFSAVAGLTGSIGHDGKFHAGFGVTFGVNLDRIF